MNYGDEKREKLDRLEKKLYSRNAPNVIDQGRSDLNQTLEGINKQTNEYWQDVKRNNFDELAARVSRAAQSRYSFVKKIFIISLLFFVAAAGIAAFIFLGGMNAVSSKNVDIKVVGPLSVAGGQEVSFDLNIINGNNIDLDSASLLIEYPEGTRSMKDLSKELDRERFSLGKIKSQESYRQNIKVVFFGEKESIKKMKISLEYRVENSSALFYKEKTHEVSISSAPVIITPIYPKEVNSNQEISFNIEAASNSKDKIENFLVNVEYPFGFVFKESSPKPSFGNNVWKFSSLSPGERKMISIKGNIIGQNNEERVFRINTGTASENDERVIAVPLSQLTESILVKKSFIGLDVLIAGNEGNVSAHGGSRIGAELIVRNNLPSKIFNVSVQAAFKGGAFNRMSVSAGNGGFFQSFNDTILWDKRSVVSFGEIGPGSDERLSFQISPLPYSEIKSGDKPEIEITVTAKGERVLESGSIEEVSTTEIRKITLATDIALSSRSVRSIGNIENYGPVPPKADTPTTYTIVWNINNSFNQVSNVEVRATLPPYVKWTNLKSPDNEIISLNSVTNEIVWNVGSVLPNTGFASSGRQVYFQLEFLPSLSQIGQTPVLLGEATLSGIDKITGLKVESKSGAVTTNFYGDPSYRTGDDKVTK